MASPFHVFRKNQRILIATLGLLAIGAFVFLPMVLKLMGDPSANRSSENPVVVKTSKYGNLTARDIVSMQNQQKRLFRFFDELVKRTCGDNFFLLRQNLMGIHQFFGDSQEEAVVKSWLLTQRAKELGMQVNDEAVHNFFKNVTNNNVDPELIKELLNQSQMPEDALFALMKEKLLALNLEASLLVSLSPETPAQRWDQFQRLRRMVSAQVSPVVVADYEKKVKDPSEKELKEFFEKYKNVVESSDSSEPGFRIPQMAQIKYLKADFDYFFSPQSVSEEEIKKYYDENRKYYKKVSLPGREKDTDDKPSDLLRGGLSDRLKIDTDISPTKEAPANEPVQEDKSETSPATPETGAPEEATTPGTTEPKTTPAPAKDKPESSSSDTARGLYHLVSMQEPDDKNKAADPKASKTPKSELTAKPSMDTPSTTTEAEPKSDQTKEELSPKTQKPTTTDTDTNPSAIGASLSELSIPSNAPMTLGLDEYKTLEEVKDEIRSELAPQKARERMKKEITTAREEVDKYYELAAISESEKDKPVLNLKKLAKKHGLTHHQTDLSSARELSKTDVGYSQVVGAKQSVADMILEGDHDEQLRVSIDPEQNFYLFWRVKKTKEKTPDLDDENVRKKVIDAWKKVKARDLAMAEAKRLAEIAKKSGKTLKNSIAKTQGVTVRSTGFFTWLKLYTPPGPWQETSVIVNQPTNIDKVGHKFMKAVYSLKPSEITEATNKPKTVVYVIQLIETDSSEKEVENLWNQFKKESPQYYKEVANDDLRRTYSRWESNLKKEANLTWERPPIQLRETTR